jgi:hypothetical protein
MPPVQPLAPRTSYDCGLTDQEQIDAVLKWVEDQDSYTSWEIVNYDPIVIWDRENILSLIKFIQGLGKSGPSRLPWKEEIQGSNP